MSVSLSSVRCNSSCFCFSKIESTLSAYHGTKFALEGLSESIAYELEPFGIRVVIIEPGVIRPNILKLKRLSKKRIRPKIPVFFAHSQS